MHKYETTELHAYGVVIPKAKFSKKKVTKLLTPYVPKVKSIFDKRLEADTLLDVFDGDVLHVLQHYDDIREEVERKGREMKVKDLAQRAELFSSLLEWYLFRNFPLVRATVLALDKNGNEGNVLICVDRSVLYLELAKVEDKKKVSKQEKAQIREFLELIDFKDKPSWNNFEYVNTPAKLRS